MRACVSICNFAAYMASGAVGAPFQWLPKQQKVLSAGTGVNGCTGVSGEREKGRGEGDVKG